MSDKSQDSKSEVEEAATEPLPWDKGPGAKLVLDKMGIDEDENVLVVTLDAEIITVESKVRPQEYEQVQLRQVHAPQGFQVHIPINNPGKLVNDTTGNVAILRRVHEVLARELDGLAFQVASERVDRKVAAGDQQAATKTQRFDAGEVRKGVVAAQKAGEVL